MESKQGENSGTIRSVLCTVAMAIGLLIAVGAGIGMYQLRVIASPEFTGDYGSYQVVGFVWGLFDNAQQPAKPAETAGKVQTMFLACGLLGIVLAVAGGIALMLPGRKRQPADR